MVNKLSQVHNICSLYINDDILIAAFSNFHFRDTDACKQIFTDLLINRTVLAFCSRSFEEKL